MELKKIVVKSFQTNAYVYYDKASGEGVIIDPAGEAKEIIKFLTDNSIKIKYILLTHGHYDHIMAVEEVAAHTRAQITAGADESELLGDPRLNFSDRLGEGIKIKIGKPLKDGDVLKVGGANLKVLHTPGHTKGGVCYYDEQEGTLFSGDTLFHESVGRTDFPGGSMDVLERSIAGKLFSLPEDTMVYPGHMRMTTIGHERENNPFVRG